MRSLVGILIPFPALGAFVSWWCSLRPSRPRALSSWLRPAVCLMLISGGSSLTLSEETAAAYFKQVLLIDSRNFTASYNLGLLARDARRYVEAAQYLEKARQLLPSDAPTLLALTGAYLGAGQPEPALSTANELVSLNPANPQIH